VAFDFSTDPEFQEKLDWIDQFVREEVEPLDHAFTDLEYHPPSPALAEVVRPLQQRVRDQGHWACHLTPDLGGQGYGQVKLALMNEILGRSGWAPIIFGTQAPDTGNAEILAHFGTDEQKEKYLRPLLDGEIFSCYSMTEPQGGSDPKQFKTRAVRDGDEWVITGEKFFSSNARTAEFLIVMVVTNPDVNPHQGMSMFLVPTDTPGLIFERNIGLMGETMNDGMHGWIRYDGVRLPAANMLGEEGQGFLVAQTRLGGGRIHHAMRTVARVQLALDAMCERAQSRYTQGSRLADKQLVQADIADSWIALKQLRLLVLYTAWLIDEKGSASAVRKEIAACKIQAANVMYDVIYKAVRLHGALGVSNETPLAKLWMITPNMSLTDGPTEVHKITVARQILKDYPEAEGVMPSCWLPPKIEAARERFADVLSRHVDNL
jgi:acyl-CoA dehydrogenase